jgi:hypothetical protein
LVADFAERVLLRRRVGRTVSQRRAIGSLYIRFGVAEKFDERFFRTTCFGQRREKFVVVIIVVHKVVKVDGVGILVADALLCNVRREIAQRLRLAAISQMRGLIRVTACK